MQIYLIVNLVIYHITFKIGFVKMSGYQRQSAIALDRYDPEDRRLRELFFGVERRMRLREDPWRRFRRRAWEMFSEKWKSNKGESMEIKEAFHKWANGGKTLVAYGPRDEGGYSLQEYNGGKPQELFWSDSLEEIQAAFGSYYAVKQQVEKGMPWKVAGNHLVVCSAAPDGKFEVREYNAFKNRVERPLERCDTLKQAEEALEKCTRVARTMTEFNSLTERQQHFEHALREARHVDAGTRRTAVQRHAAIEKMIEVGR
jgi:hypothetical protein